MGQFLNIHEREGGETGKDKDVTDVCELAVCELVCHNRFQFILRQILPFLYIRADVELCKGVAWYQSVVMSFHDHTFQPHAV